MINVLLALEPRYEQGDTLLFNTNQDTEEMFFINSGSIDVGFELNTDRKYCLRLIKGGSIGFYNCTFNKRTMFVYKVNNYFKGMTIRKTNW